MRVHKSDLIKSYIDLDHVLVIGDAYFSDMMGMGGFFVGFTITMAFLDNPIVFTFKVREYRLKDSNYELEFMNADGTPEWAEIHTRDIKEAVCMVKLQTHIEVLVTAWTSVS